MTWVVWLTVAATEMTVAEARAALAEVLSTVGGVTVRDRASVALTAPGDGWVTVRRGVPAGFVGCDVEFAVVVVLGYDPAQADARLDEWMVPLLDAVSSAEYGWRGFAAVPELLVVDQQQRSLHVLIITVTASVGG